MCLNLFNGDIFILRNTLDKTFIDNSINKLQQFYTNNSPYLKFSKVVKMVLYLTILKLVIGQSTDHLFFLGIKTNLKFITKFKNL